MKKIILLLSGVTLSYIGYSQSLKPADKEVVLRNESAFTVDQDEFGNSRHEKQRSGSDVSDFAFFEREISQEEKLTVLENRSYKLREYLRNENLSFKDRDKILKELEFLNLKINK